MLIMFMSEGKMLILFMSEGKMLILTHFCRVDCYLNLLNRFFSSRRGVQLVLVVTIFYRNI